MHASDPAGGSEWALRSWQGRPNPKARFGGGSRPSRFVCYQIGIRLGGQLLQPRFGASPRPLEAGQEEDVEGGGGCSTKLPMWPTTIR